MRRYIILIIILLPGITQRIYSQSYTITGKIINQSDQHPVGYATVSFTEVQLWTVSDENGVFTLKNVPAGKATVTIHCLGFVKMTSELDVKGDASDLLFQLAEDNLALDEVVVTATRKTKELTTSYTIDRTTLDHAQVLNVANITSLLPGGKSAIKQDLTTDERFTLRSESGEKGNTSFGTAIEVDGVRLQNNAAFDETKGTDVRTISSTNIESIEVITGIASVEHGDLSGGLVKVETKKGKTPLTIDLSTTPNIKQVAVSKGFTLGANAGMLNPDFEHTKSVADPASPYTSYERNAFSLRYSHTLNKTKGMPLSIEAGFSGNLGGYNSKNDPDAFKGTYTQKKNDNFRGNVSLKWLLNKPWITNVELSGAVNYSNQLSKKRTNKSSSSSQAAIHTQEEGYFIATNYEEDPDAPVLLLPAGYWHHLQFHDSKPISYIARLKADWTRQPQDFPPLYIEAQILIYKLFAVIMGNILTTYDCFHPKPNTLFIKASKVRYFRHILKYFSQKRMKMMHRDSPVFIGYNEPSCFHVFFSEKSPDFHKCELSYMDSAINRCD